MATIIVSSDIAGNVKPSFATSPATGLTVRANGEEKVQVLDANGNAHSIQMPQAAAAPTFTDTGSGGLLPPNKFAAWFTVYAATTRYPLVENDITIDGSIAPRGNPNVQAAHQITADGQSVELSFPQSEQDDIDQIWIFRTEFFDTANEASVNAIAGNAFFIGAVDNDPTAGGTNTTFVDENSATGVDQVETDNGYAPCFRYVTYADPYWYGWGNVPFQAQGEWDTDGNLTLTEADKKWFNGRDGQFVRLEGITDGGLDGQGTYLFRFVTETTGALDIEIYGDGLGTVSSAGSGTIVIQGPSSSLYRSKPRNPFSWGFTNIIGDEFIPEQFAFKIGGGIGTAIGVVPNTSILVVCTEFPAATYTLDLRLAGTDDFRGSLRQISDFYSFSSHFSLFPATRSDNKVVLWGWDAKNYCILETDGFSIYPVSREISKTLRKMTQDRSRQQLAHGAYDARNQLNCLWLPTANSGYLVNFLVAQHAPTGQWFMRDEKDVLCSAQFQDGDTNLNKIFIGTQSGFVGEAFAEGYFWDWLTSSDAAAGLVTAADATTITVDITLDDSDPGYLQNWCLVTDANGEHEQWAHISNVDFDNGILTFDFIYSEVGGGTSAFNPIPAAGWRFYIGLIMRSIMSRRVGQGGLTGPR